VGQTLTMASGDACFQITCARMMTVWCRTVYCRKMADSIEVLLVWWVQGTMY